MEVTESRAIPVVVINRVSRSTAARSWARRTASSP